MAEEVTGRPLKQLKQERTSAKTTFTKQANYLSRAIGHLTKSELQKEFKDLLSLVRNVSQTNDDYELGLLAEIDEDGEKKLDPKQQADLTRTIEDCNARMKEVQKMVQSNLWSRYAEGDLTFAVEEAESACERIHAIPVSVVNTDAYEHQVKVAKKHMKDIIDMFMEWEEWIPREEKVLLGGRVKGLQKLMNSLETKKAEFLTVQRTAEEERRTATQAQSAVQPAQLPILKIKPTSLPTFNGSKRDFHQWKKDWESLQRQGEPTGSAEAKKFQLLDSVNEGIRRDLRLSTYKSAEDMFKVLENRFGNKTTIALEIIEDLEKIPPLQSSQPRKMIDMIQSVEKALNDLTELGDIGAIKNPLVIRSIEGKLPDVIKKDWLVFMLNPENTVTPENHFDSLLTFLKNQEKILERLEQLEVKNKPDKKYPYSEQKYAKTQATRQGGCIICGDERHSEKLFFCKKFKELTPEEKLEAVEKLGACTKCLECHQEDNECKDTYLCRNQRCRRDHHFFLCRRGDSKKKETYRTGMIRLTEEQEQFVAELSPDMVEKFKSAFSNVTARSHCTDKRAGMDLEASQELPVIMMLLEVTANTGQKIGTLIDLASDTNYITHQAAKRLNLRSEKVTLIVHGVGGMALKMKTKRYLLRVRVKTPTGTVRIHELLCYGLDEIAKVNRPIQPEQLKKFFPDTSLRDLHRPQHIELLISHREGRLAPQRVKVIEDLVLWESPLGKTVAGAHPDLFEEVDITTHSCKTHFAHSMRTSAVKHNKYTEVRLGQSGRWEHAPSGGASPVRVTIEKDHDALQRRTKGKQRKTPSQRPPVDTTMKDLRLAKDSAQAPSKPKWEGMLSAKKQARKTHNLCDLSGFKHREVKWEVIRRQREKYRNIHAQTIHLSSSRPAGGRQTISAQSQPAEFATSCQVTGSRPYYFQTNLCPRRQGKEMFVATTKQTLEQRNQLKTQRNPQFNDHTQLVGD